MTIVERLANLVVQYAGLAFVIEAVMERFVAPLPILRDEKFKEVRASALQWMAGLIGVGIAFGFNVRFLVLLDVAPQSAWADAVDAVLTGLLLSRGSSLVHDMMMMRFLEKELLKLDPFIKE